MNFQITTSCPLAFARLLCNVARIPLYDKIINFSIVNPFKFSFFWVGKDFLFFFLGWGRQAYLQALVFRVGLGACKCA